MWCALHVALSHTHTHMKKKKKKKKKRRHDLFFQFHVVFFLFLPLTEFSVPFYALTQTTDGCYFLNTHTR